METKEILKQLRKSKGFSMQEFCKIADINFSTYQNYESGKRTPTAEILIKLADFYNVTTDYLLGREPMPNPFDDLGLDMADEEAVYEVYKSLPDNVRAILLATLKQLANAIPDNDVKPTVTMTMTTTTGELEKLNAKAKEKDII